VLISSVPLLNRADHAGVPVVRVIIRLELPPSQITAGSKAIVAAGVGYTVNG
jgi:hypothetical protein